MIDLIIVIARIYSALRSFHYTIMVLIYCSVKLRRSMRDIIVKDVDFRWLKPSMKRR